MSKNLIIGAVTVEKLITAVEGLNGLKKHKKGVVKYLAGKYKETGEKIKREKSGSVELIRQMRNSV